VMEQLAARLERRCSNCASRLVCIWLLAVLAQARRSLHRSRALTGPYRFTTGVGVASSAGLDAEG
jgi:hypothetical protein